MSIACYIYFCLNGFLNIPVTNEALQFSAKNTILCSAQKKLSSLSSPNYLASRIITKNVEAQLWVTSPVKLTLGLYLNLKKQQTLVPWPVTGVLTSTSVIDMAFAAPISMITLYLLYQVNFFSFLIWILYDYLYLLTILCHKLNFRAKSYYKRNKNTYWPLHY